MPYVPPHLRAQSYYADKPAPRIAKNLDEAQAMSKAVTKEAPKNILGSMLSAPAPKLAGQVSVKRNQTKNTPLGNLHAAKSSLISNKTSPVATGSFGAMVTPPKVEPKKAKMIAHVEVSVTKEAVVESNPAFEAAMDDILRTLFEDSMKNVKRIASAQADNFARRSSGSYQNERLESRFQGFKMQKLEECGGKASDALDKALRARFEIAMQGVKRIASAAPLDFISRRSNGAYVNERLESRYQGYLMGSVNDFGLSVLRKIAENRVEALKTLR